MEVKVAILVLLIHLHLGMGDIKCELKTGVSKAYNKIGDKAAQGLKLHSGRTINNMDLFQCTCTDRSNRERFGDSDIRDLGEFESGEHRWDRAEILRIYGCDELDLTLRTNRDDFSDYMSGKILIVEDIKLLDLDFTAGLSPESDNSFYTFSSIYFRDVTFYNFPNAFIFEDRHEVVFERVKFDPSSTQKIEIDIVNKNVSVDPVVRIEGSEFPGFTEVSRVNEQRVLIVVENKQQIVDEPDQCYEYKGELHVINNKFESLARQSIFNKGGKKFKFEGNTVNLLDEESIDVENLMQAEIVHNNLGFAEKFPVLNFFFNKGPEDCNKDNLPVSKIGKYMVKNNRMHSYRSQMAKIDPDPAYPDTFVNDKFEVSENGGYKVCNCTDLDHPSNPDDEDKLTKMFHDSQTCLSNQRPPLVGKKSDICEGRVPKSKEELKMDREDTIDRWTVYLVVAIFVTMILTAIVTFVIAKFCCSGEKDPTVSPRD